MNVVYAYIYILHKNMDNDPSGTLLDLKATQSGVLFKLASMHNTILYMQEKIICFRLMCCTSKVVGDSEIIIPFSAHFNKYLLIATIKKLPSQLHKKSTNSRRFGMTNQLISNY